MVDQNQPVNDPQAVTEPAATGAANTEVDGVDERGVSWKNVAMEKQRKLEEMEDRIKSIESRVQAQPPYAPYPYAVAPQVAPQQPQPVVNPEERLNKFVANPDEFFETLYQKRRREELMGEANDYLLENGLNAQEVAQTIMSNGIDMSHPLKAVKRAIKLLDSKKQDIARQAELKHKDDIRLQEELKKQQIIKQTQPLPGNKPTVTPSHQSDEFRAKAVQTGKEKDVTDFFRSRFIQQ
jgi:hypothetical protein